MKYSDFINANESFQYSINLQYDLNSLIKINSYIPTKESVEILDKYLKSIYYDSKERASVLVGPYGKGKSHLLLVLLSIISLKDEVFDDKNKLNSTEVMKNLIEKIENINSNTADLIKNIRKSRKPFMPVIINNNYNDLQQAFLIGVSDALKREKLSNIKPDTYFDIVETIIERWKKVDDAFEKFENILKKYKLTLVQFKKGISSYDEKTYEIFKKIYPNMTYGAKFNPMINSDIVKLYEQINIEICNSGNYSGMFIVFDEFSKFLESNVNKKPSSDLKIIQDFAELSTRSGENQIHFVSITHKDFADYLVNLPKKRIDEWKAVEGRFSQVLFTTSSQQNYQLISNAIMKDTKKFNKFFLSNKSKFEEIAVMNSRFNLFEGLRDYFQIIIKNCFPLNPITVYALPRVSEKVAQNERTLFTFLSKNEQGSLIKFINNEIDNIEYLTLDWVYDYFEVLFKKEVFNNNVYEVYLKSVKCLNKVKDKNCRKIIKSIAIIYIVNELEKLAPIDSVIQASLNLDKDEYKEAKDFLINNHIILKNKSNEFYRFSLLNNIDIHKNIEKVKASKLNNINIKNILEEVIDLGYILPKRYNDEFKMIRFFKNVFITINELRNINSAVEFLNIYKSDGIVLHLLYFNDDEKKEANKELKRLNDKRILMCIPKEVFSIEDSIKEFAAIQILKRDKELVNSDDYAIEELNIYEEDITNNIKEYIEANFQVENYNCEMFNLDNIEILKRSELTKEISNICEEIYNKTPKINNELINKMKLTGQISKARKKIIDYIVKDIDRYPDIKLEGNSPEATIFRATIENKNLLNDKKVEGNLIEVLNEIEKFILSCEESKKSFSNIYNVLCSAPYGLRAGIMPIYIALKMKEKKENIVIYFKNKEIRLSSEALNNLNRNPYDYYLYIEKGTKEKVRFINELYDLFKKYSGEKKLENNKFTTVLESMQNWIQSLPKYTREYKKIFTINGIGQLSKEEILFRKELLKFNINPREFLFDVLIKKIFKENDYENCLKYIINIKEQFDSHIDRLKDYLIKETKQYMAMGYAGSLSSALENWYKNLNKVSKTFVYDETTNEFIKYINESTTHNDYEKISKLAYIITGLNIEDWKDEIVPEFIKKLKEILNKINKNKINNITEENSYKIIFSKNNKNVEKVFKKEDITSLGETVFNQLENIMEEYGEAISDSEKRNILMKIMKKFL